MAKYLVKTSLPISQKRSLFFPLFSIKTLEYLHPLNESILDHAQGDFDWLINDNYFIQMSQLKYPDSVVMFIDHYSFLKMIILIHNYYIVKK